MQREEQVREQLCSAEEAHLRGARVQREHPDERQRDQRNLVAEERDRLADPEAAEVAQLERRRQPDQAPRRRGDQPRLTHARTTSTSPLIEAARSSTSGASSAGCSSPSSSSELRSPLIARASTHTFDPWRIPMLMSPDIDCSSTLPAVTPPMRWSPEAVLILPPTPASYPPCRSRASSRASSSSALTSSSLPRASSSTSVVVPPGTASSSTRPCATRRSRVTSPGVSKASRLMAGGPARGESRRWRPLGRSCGGRASRRAPRHVRTAAGTTSLLLSSGRSR